MKPEYLVVVIAVVLTVIIIIIGFSVPHPKIIGIKPYTFYKILNVNTSTIPVMLYTTNTTCGILYNNHYVRSIIGNYTSIGNLLPNTNFIENSYDNFSTFVSYSIKSGNITCTREILISNKYFYLFPYAYNKTEILINGS
jgi:hypothetical protein